MSRSEPIIEIAGGVQITVHAQPVDGKANEELARFLSDTLGVAKNDVLLSRGEKSRSKIFEVRGITLADARSRLF